MRLAPVAALSLAALLPLSACSLIYKLPTRQGNVLEQKQLDQLKVGMTHDQVAYLLGTPIAASPYRGERWDYLGYYRSPRGDESRRVVSLFFDGDSLSRMEGIQDPTASATATLSAKEIRDQQKKDQLDAERAVEDTKGVIAPAPLPNP